MAISTKYWTLEELITKVERDLDLQEEDFIQPEEMVGYVNEAVDEAEKLVHSLYEDYFLTRETFTITGGIDEYAFPDGIFAHKIRTLSYKFNGLYYTCTRIRDWKKFEIYQELRERSPGTCEIGYFLVNAVAGEPKILFTPVPQDTGAVVTIWYLRQANRLETNADILDIPEAANFVMQFVKMRCYEKEGGVNLAKAVNDLEILTGTLTSTLTDMVPDADNGIEMDLSAYEEMN